MEKKFIYILLFFVLLPVLTAKAELFGAKEFYLDNGLRVIVVENHRVPIVKHMVWYKAGAADEIPGKGGSAHLLEHLMFRGTSNVSGQELNRLLEANGAESNAFTGQDMTAYHQLLDISRLELAMFLEADRMQNLKIKPDDFETERSIVFQERKERVDNNPLGSFREAVNRALWQEHPYARPVTGVDAEIKNLKKEDLLEFYRRYYAPNNAVLVLAGDIDVPTAKELAEKYYGEIPAAEVVETEMPELQSEFDATITMRKPDIKGSRILIMFAAPSYKVEAEDVYNLQVLAAYMGGGDTSKLYKKLVLESKKALGVSVDYNPISRSYGQFVVAMVPTDGERPQELVKAFENAWNEAMSEFSIDELEKIRKKMLAGLVYLRDNPEDAAYIVGSMAVAGVSLGEIEAQEDKLKALRLSEVHKVAEKLVRSAPKVIGILQPLEDGNDGEKQ